MLRHPIAEHRGLIHFPYIRSPANLEHSEGVDFRDSPSSHSGSTYSSPRPEPSQEVTRLLLFSIFAIAARFTDDDPPQDNKMWEAGCDYLDSARNILSLSFIYLCLYSPMFDILQCKSFMLHGLQRCNPCYFLGIGNLV